MYSSQTAVSATIIHSWNSLAASLRDTFVRISSILLMIESSEKCFSRCFCRHVIADILLSCIFRSGNCLPLSLCRHVDALKYERFPVVLLSCGISIIPSQTQNISLLLCRVPLPSRSLLPMWLLPSWCGYSPAPKPDWTISWFLRKASSDLPAAWSRTGRTYLD
jgi:hypothetical protein